MMKNPWYGNQALETEALYYDPSGRDITNMRFDENGFAHGDYPKKPKGVELLENGDVVFRIYAPNAKTVEVAGFGGRMSSEKVPMKKGENGLWEVTISGIPAGFHYHDYFVDGNRVTSDLAPYGYGAFRSVNYFEKPDEESGFYLLQDVPHGTIRMDYYKSSITGKFRSCFVYTPPGYETDKDERYPVIYLQHGGGEAETGWLWQGKIHYIMDNLIAQGICRKAIVVMNNGYAFDRSAIENPNMGSIGEVIVHDCVPFIDKKYRTIPDRKMRAMAGLSMGGFQTQEVVFRHPDVFANLAMLSGTLLKKYEGDDYTAIFEDPQVFKNDFGVFFLSMGSEEKSLIENNLSLAEELRAKGVDVKTFITPGYHEWEVWRYSIREFLKFAFQA